MPLDVDFDFDQFHDLIMENEAPIFSWRSASVLLVQSGKGTVCEPLNLGTNSNQMSSGLLNAKKHLSRHLRSTDARFLVRVQYADES